MPLFAFSSSFFVLLWVIVMLQKGVVNIYKMDK